MHALPADIAKYQGKYDGGYAAIRQTRYRKLLQLGLIDETAKLSPIVGDWATQEHQEWEKECMEVYAAMVDSMDQGIGKIVASLEKQGSL